MNINNIYIPGIFYWKDLNGYYLGCNKDALDAFGLKSEKDLIGKTAYDLWPEQAEIIRINDNYVMEAETQMSFEEMVILCNGKKKFFISTKAPLRDDNKNIIGIVGNSVDITYRKKMEDEKFVIGYTSQNKRVNNYLKEIASCMPGNFYWKDKQGYYLGCNQELLNALDLKEEKDIIGKTDYDLWPEQANEILANDQIVMGSEKPIHFKETVTMKGGNPMFFAVVKVALRDANGNVVGIIGNSLDITYHKKAEDLKLEAELHKAKLQEHIARTAIQVSHDIRTPLSSLEMMIKCCSGIPEAMRISLRSAILSITDIANNLLAGQRKYKNSIDAEPESIQLILVSLAISELLSLKRIQCSNLPVTLNYFMNSNSSFIFIKANPSNFSRMLLNIINNSVDAFEGKTGVVDTSLDIEDKQVKITIQDNGKGIPREVLNKIRNNIAVTANKNNGNGIGLTQVRSALSLSNGKMQIESEVGFGTKTILTFPIVSAPNWIVENIVLHKGDTIIILDDDHSIHDAWNMRFEKYSNLISLKHLKKGEEVIDFINDSNDSTEKNKIFLLADFELIGQKLNGLEVIEQAAISSQQSILVTSHYNRQEVRDLAVSAGVKILPKQLAIDVPIEIKERNESVADNLKKINLVIVDNDQLHTDCLTNLLKNKFSIETL